VRERRWARKNKGDREERDGRRRLHVLVVLDLGMPSVVSDAVVLLCALSPPRPDDVQLDQLIGRDEGDEQQNLRRRC
jgi:hypothetical protein